MNRLIEVLLDPSDNTQTTAGSAVDKLTVLRRRQSCDEVLSKVDVSGANVGNISVKRRLTVLSPWRWGRLGALSHLWFN